MIELIFQSELLLVKQINQENVIFIIIGTFWIKTLIMKKYLCNDCHDLMQKTMDLNDVAFVSIKGNDYRIYFLYMSKNDAII